MANVCISNTCNLGCSYCFAAPHMAAAPPDARFIRAADFDDRLDFLSRSGIAEARLIGGEPTLHPEFPALVERARSRIGRVVVFTNGCVPERALRALEALPPETCTVIVNLTPEGGQQVAPPFLDRRRATLHRLGSRAVAGVTVVKPRFDFGWLPPLIRDAGCRPSIRIGLAHPCVDGGNDYLHPKQYPPVGAGVVDLARHAADFGVRLEFDCGFVRCMFSDDELAKLSDLGTDLGWRCGPVADIDVTGRIVHCFPLSTRAGVRAGPNEDAGDVRRRLSAAFAGFRLAGVYPECSTCSFRATRECGGGCLAATMRRFRSNSFRVRRPDRARDDPQQQAKRIIEEVLP